MEHTGRAQDATPMNTRNAALDEIDPSKKAKPDFVIDIRRRKASFRILRKKKSEFWILRIVREN